jgi:hypothetical protein
MGREIRPEGVASDDSGGEEEEEAGGAGSGAPAAAHAAHLAQLRALGAAALGHAEGGSALEARLAELMSGGAEGEEEEECVPRGTSAVACALLRRVR